MEEDEEDIGMKKWGIAIESMRPGDNNSSGRIGVEVVEKVVVVEE